MGAKTSSLQESEQDSDSITADEIYAIIGEFSGESVGLTAAFIILALATTIIQIVAISKLTARFQKAISDADTNSAMWSFFYMMVALIVAFGLHYAYDVVENNLFPLFTAFAEKRLMKTILEKNATGADANSDPNLFREILNRTTSSAGHVYYEILATIIPNALVILTMFGYLTFLNWKYGLVFVLTGASIAGVVVGSQSITMQCAKDHETIAKSTEWRAFDIIRNMPVVAARNMVSVEVEDLGGRFDVVAKDKIKYRQLIDNLSYIVQLISYSAVFIVLWLAIASFQKMIEGQKSGKANEVANKQKRADYSKQVLTIVAVLMSTRARLQSITKSQINMTDSVGKFGFINNKVDELNSRQIEEGEVTGVASNDIRFTGLNVSYEDPVYHEKIPVLTQLSLDIKPNECMVIRGASGSGKSTLVKTLMRLLEPDSGSIEIGGVPVREFALRTGLRRFVAFVTAEQGILDRSIQDNVLYGCLPEDYEASLNRAKELWADFKEHLFPNKELEDRAGPNGGCELSTGQKTWVKLANLFVLGQEKKIVVLDEPTQGLDPRTKTSILSLLERLKRMRTMTTLIITHDEDCAKVGDRVAHLVSGTIQNVETPKPPQSENS